MNLALSAADAHETAIVGARAQSAAGLGPGHRVVHCLNYRLWMGGFSDHTTLEATGATVVPFGVGETQLLVRTIRELGITAISCTPSYPAVLARVIADHFPGMRPRDLGLQLGLFGGEGGSTTRISAGASRRSGASRCATRITAYPTCSAISPARRSRTTTSISWRSMCSIPS